MFKSVTFFSSIGCLTYPSASSSFFLHIADIDECTIPDSCDKYSDCTDIIGSFECACKDGFIETSEGFCEGRI